MKGNDLSKNRADVLAVELCNEMMKIVSELWSRKVEPLLA